MQDIANTPKSIMRIAVPDGSVKREKDIKATALPMLRAIEWLDEAKRLEAVMLDATTQEALMESMSAVVDAICDYDPDWPHDAIRENASAIQITNALSILMEMNDPLAAARAKKEEEAERGLKMLERLGGGVNLQPLIEKHISEAFAESRNGTA
jgi:hypothetical protein